MAVSEQRFAGTDKKFFTVEKKGGINTESPRESIKDTEFSWLENMQPIKDGNFRSLYSNGASIYTASATIIYFYPFNVGAVQYIAVFLSDGTAVSVNVASQAVTTISSNPGTFYPGDGSLGSPAPQCAQFGQQLPIEGYAFGNRTDVLGLHSKHNQPVNPHSQRNILQIPQRAD